MKTIKLGIIGGGLMGREVASALGRWFALDEYPVQVELVAVCDLKEELLDWFRKVPTVRQRTRDHTELLANAEVDVVYVAVPHDLHERIYLDVLRAGKDLLAEKPFGIDLRAAEAIRDEAARLGRFVRCSSEFPFLPGPQRVVEAVRSGKLGDLLGIRAGFLHSSDIDPRKPINWKRQVKSCGETGVMADLGIHVTHVPFRLGWKPESVFAQLVNIVRERPDGNGGVAACDTWDNAILHTAVRPGDQPVPMTLETKRIAPGETNTWYIEVAGMEGAVRYSTKEPKTLWTFRRDGEQWWQKTDLGFQTPFRTISGGIFEPGFPDAIMQMLAAFVAEREGFLGGRFGCVTPDEAVASQALFAAALESHRTGGVVTLAGR
ncbi:MAG: Gfo/Idh/MocA family oxidoreductase [Gemmatimonadetes bacterium]|nr:Gfo/Idh/MocA family oxidoreductase [Gemmatimonadota bacterium]